MGKELRTFYILIWYRLISIAFFQVSVIFAIVTTFVPHGDGFSKPEIAGIVLFSVSAPLALIAALPFIWQPWAKKMANVVEKKLADTDTIAEIAKVDRSYIKFSILASVRALENGKYKDELLEKMSKLTFHAGSRGANMLVWNLISSVIRTKRLMKKLG